MPCCAIPRRVPDFFENPFKQISLTVNVTDGEHFDIFW
ncbi:hypothetical protein Z948_1267 [Sulfitobacter donghicola DSW-25 = KCTC 12864 = JCM 14565]|nr:hypothetical protein Z948_1267 [Sulfitobacter donghicola DSW-25 = KCTC 12864 = JCM 14565]